MRVLACAIGIVAVSMPCDAAARENTMRQASPQFISLPRLDAGLTYRDRQPAGRRTAVPRATGIAPAPAGFKPLRPSFGVMHLGLGGASRVRTPLAVSSVEDELAVPPIANSDHWRDFTGMREMPDPPPTPGSYTDRMIVLSIRDFGSRPSVSVTGGMAGTALHVLGADGAVQLR